MAKFAEIKAFTEAHYGIDVVNALLSGNTEYPLGVKVGQRIEIRVLNV